jgi:homoserine O-acetyltransferase
MQLWGLSMHRRCQVRVFAYVLIAFASISPVFAQQTLVHVIPHFQFESGQTLQDMKVGYDLYGKLNAAKDNAILLGHGSAGGRKQYATYIGPGKLYDTEKYLVIAIDAIGGGTSSSPKDGLGADFPRYNIRDIMRAEHDLMTRGLGLTQLRAVQGGSLGALVALEWGINYPDIMRGLILHAPSARIDNHLRMVVEAMVAAINLDPKFHGGRYAENPVEGLRLAGLILTPWLLSDDLLETLRTEEQYQNASKRLPNAYAAWDANSLIGRYLATAAHDVAKPFGGDQRAALSRVKAQVLIMPCVNDRALPPHLAREIAEGIPHAVYVEVRSRFGHAALFQADEKTLEYQFITEKTRAFLDRL